MPHVTSAATQIYWEEAGASVADDRREPLLLIMGLGATLEWWQRLIPILTPRYRTIVYDNRGVGRSDVPPGPYSIRQMAEDAAAVMDAAGLESAHVFGASMGGMIAQELALHHPSRVRSLILGCTACGGKHVVPASREVGIALSARATMTREQAMWTMAPYIFDEGTPRERVAEDIAVRLRATVSNDGYFAQLAAVRAWEGTHDRLAGAVLDVFETEPLPSDHVFWRLPNVRITSHTAALSAPPDIAPIFVDNYRRLLRGEPLQYRVDFERGY